MTIILLSGKSKSGKTTTLNELYKLLVQGQQNPPPKKALLKPPPYTIIPNQTIPISKLDEDFECELTYKGKKVAIYSMGDIMWRTYRTIIEFCNKADVLIIAYNTDGSKRLELLNSVAANPNHHIIPKTANNQADCQTIISKI